MITTATAANSSGTNNSNSSGNSRSISSNSNSSDNNRSISSNSSSIISRVQKRWYRSIERVGHDRDEPDSVGGTVACESALRSAGILLSRFPAPPSARRPDGGP
ncbi:hypothetical protein PoB_004646000 [Plakobranchus ocellatus]|uniref:Uncharacterized protein n=1 Tax=Plakobranchus ocellatus TaxID=259542 RepID=A0AAV4BKE5_9GAST|nr:hypothetical protein PoB_004646000 [Plakobranchus ocellatus]